MNDDKRQEIIQKLKKYVNENLTFTEFSDEELETKIEEIYRDMFSDVYISIEDKVNIIQEVYSSIRGFELLDTIIS